MCKEGWALKPVRTSKRFPLKVKDLKDMWINWKWPDYNVIAEEFKTRRNSNGEKMFGQDEWLSSGQIISLFWNFVRKNVSVKFFSISANSDLRLQDSKTDKDLHMAIAEIETLQHHTDMIQVAASFGTDTCETLFSNYHVRNHRQNI